MTPGKPGFMTYFDTIEPYAALLTDEQFGKLEKALIKYAKNGEEPSIDDRFIELAFATVRRSIEKDDERYLKERTDKRKAGRAGAEARWGKDGSAIADDGSAMAEHGSAWQSVADDSRNGQLSTINPTVNPTVTPNNNPQGANTLSLKSLPQTEAAPPSVEEIRTFCTEAGIEADPYRFIRENSARGWMDSHGEPIRDWRQWLLNWVNRQPHQRTEESITERANRIFNQIGGSEQ